MSEAMKARNDTIIASVERHLSAGATAEKASERVCAELAGTFDISMHTVLRVWKAARRAAGQPHRNAALSADQQERLLIALEVFAIHNCALTPDKAVQHVRSAFGITISSKTIKRLVETHPGRLKLCKSVFLTAVRASADSLWLASEFCNTWERFFEENHFPPHCIFNYDETTMYVDTESQLVIESARRARPNSLGIKAKSLCTCLVVVDSTGKPFLIAFCLKKQSSGTVDVPVPQGRWTIPTFYYYSPTGYFNQELFGQVMDRFCELWEAQHGTGLNAVLIGDNCGIHKDVKVMERCLKHLVYLFFFPPNSSHFLQPLDDSVFATLKKLLLSKVREISWDTALLSFPAAELLFGAMFEAISETLLNEKNIQHAWKATGLAPYDRVTIMTNAAINLGCIYDHRDDQRNDMTEAVTAAVARDCGKLIEEARVRIGGKRRSSVQRMTVDGTHGFLSTDLIAKAAADAAAKVQKTSRGGSVRTQVDLPDPVEGPETAETGRTRPESTAVGKCALESCIAGSMRGCKLFACKACDLRVCLSHLPHKHHCNAIS